MTIHDVPCLGPAMTPPLLNPTCWHALHVSTPPHARLTLHVAEAARRALMARVGERVRREDMPSQLIARQDDGSPAAGHHHLFILPCGLERPGVIDTLLFGAQQPLDPSIVTGLHELSTIRVHRGPALVVHMDELPEAPFRASTTFASTTPFVCPHFPKLRRGQPRRHADGAWLHGPEQQLRLLLAKQGLPDPAPLAAHDVRFGVWNGGSLIPWHAFERKRRYGGGRQGLAEGFGWRLTFPCPITGPFASGYASHFGLGQFHPV